jgi:hypothetical protein
MAYGNWEGKDASHPEFRALFTRDALLQSDWYEERLRVKQARDVALWQRHVERLAEFLALPSHLEEARRLGIRERLARAKTELERVSASEYLTALQGTIGADPIHGRLEATRVLRAPGGNQQQLPAFTN